MKKLFAFVLAMCVGLSLLTACSGEPAKSSEAESSTAQETTATPEPTPEPTATPIPFDLTTYKDSLSKCIDEISTNALMYYNMCKFELNYWETLNSVKGTFSSEDAAQYAMEWLEKESEESADSLSVRHNTITELYKEIVFTEADGAEAEKLLEVFEEMYDNYVLIHDAAMSPSGDIDSFTSRFNDSVADFNTSKDKLETLLS